MSVSELLLLILNENLEFSIIPKTETLEVRISVKKRVGLREFQENIDITADYISLSKSDVGSHLAKEVIDRINASIKKHTTINTTIL